MLKTRWQPNFVSLLSLMGCILPIIRCTSLHCWELLHSGLYIYIYIYDDIRSVVVLFQGMGKRKYLYSSETQHTKSSRDIITWRGNECPSPTTTYRADFPSTSRITSNLNESEPIHVRSNLELRRRQLRATSAPPSHRRTAPLLAWNEPDESQHGKPGIGIRQPIRNQRPSFASETPFAQTAPAAVRSQTAPSQSFTVSETIVPLNAT